MGILTNFLKLLKPEPNDFYNQQTEQSENWDKVDKFAKDVTTDVATQDNSIWGGEYGGLIQDQTTKVVGKRYVDSADGKSYLCIKAGSNVNTSEFYIECTVKGNLEKINSINNFIKSYSLGKGIVIKEFVSFYTVEIDTQTNSIPFKTVFNFPAELELPTQNLMLTLWQDSGLESNSVSAIRFFRNRAVAIKNIPPASVGYAVLWKNTQHKEVLWK